MLVRNGRVLRGEPVSTSRAADGGRSLPTLSLLFASSGDDGCSCGCMSCPPRSRDGPSWPRPLAATLRALLDAECTVSIWVEERIARPALYGS